MFKLLVLSFFLLMSQSIFSWDSTAFKKPTKNELKKTLTDIQFDVTQNEGTERPFKNAFHDLHAEGIYVDIISGEPLFSSLDKYDSGTGWPSFKEVLDKNNFIFKNDFSLFGKRTEVRSKFSNSHLGHVFDDGPKPSGKRYCMNSASLRFIPKEKLKEAGYSEFEFLFNTESKLKNDKVETVVFGGGCFWCMQPAFDKLKGLGVIKTKVGYTGGHVLNPTYEQVSSGTTGHREVLEVTFNPLKIKLNDLLKVFWKNIDPYDGEGQFCDKGEQYTSAVYFKSEIDKKDFEMTKPKGAVKTLLLPSAKFYPAEEYHQDYYLKNPVRYKFYRFNCGRDARLKEVWGSSAH